MITSNAIKWYAAETTDNSPKNGGHMSSREIPDNEPNNVWPDVTCEERLEGAVQFRKNFIKIHTKDNQPLLEPKIYVETPTPGEDEIVIFQGTFDDTAATLAPKRFYGSSFLLQEFDARKHWLMVKRGPHDTISIFQDGDLLRISNQSTVDDLHGETIFLRLDANRAVAVFDDYFLLRLENFQEVPLVFPAETTKVSSVMEVPDMVAHCGGITIESKEKCGENDVTVELLNCSTIFETWTITFQDEDAFSCHGHRLGLVQYGSVAEVMSRERRKGFRPTNSAFGFPFFILKLRQKGWMEGDIVTFTTFPAATPVWERRKVPAGAKPHYGNKVVIAITGELG